MLAVLLMALDDHEEADNLTLLVRNYQERLYNRAYKLLGNREDAEDAVQQVFLALVKNHSAPDINDPACPAILFTAVSNKARNILKTKMRTETEELDAGVGVAESGLTPEDIDLLKDAIGRLPEDLREAIILNFHAGYTTKEIAKFQGVKQDTVQKRIKRAKEMLREMLKEDIKK